MLTTDFLNKYLVKDPPKHSFYEKSLEISKNLKYHSKGIYPAELIDTVRPKEDLVYKIYRKAVFTAITKTWFSKVVTTLGKINRAEDWSIKFPEFGSTHESLEDYTNKDYPYFDSFENWFFTVALSNMCDDPNCVSLTMPLPKNDPQNDTELLRPFNYLFPCEQVIDIKENEYAVLLATEKSFVKVNQEDKKEGVIYYFVDKTQLIKAVQVGNKEDFKFEIEGEQGYTVDHNIKYMPAFKIGGIIEEFIEGEILFDSFLGDCIPYWHEAIRRYSDHQVNMALHLHPDRWEIEDSPCRVCNSTGKVSETIEGKVYKGTCGTCNGSGSIAIRTPFGAKMIKAAQKTGPNEAVNIPTPPMGTVPRDIASIGFLKTEVKDNIKDGLAAINLEFLMNEPEINSGVAKSLDRQEMNGYFYTIARHIVENIFKPSYFFISSWRYNKVMNEKAIMETLPVINVPTKFDLLSSEILMMRLTNAKAADVSPALRTALQIEYAESEFGEDSLEAQTIKLIDQLDPLPNLTQDEKMTILSNRGTTQYNYNLSSNLPAFINRAIAENPNFMEKKYSEMLQVLDKYVQEIITENTIKVVPLMNAEEAA